jgi:4-amino-4-deoxy-L-arabinose transferase-like glycosyltransferase
MRRAVIVLFALALVVRLVLLVGMSVADPGFFYDDDSSGYVQLAMNIEDGHGFSTEATAPYLPNSFRTPGYPYFLTAIHMVTGNFESALIVQILLTIGIAWLIIAIGRKYISETVGFVAATIFLFMPFSLLVAMRYLTQVSFTATLMLALWSFLIYLKNNKPVYLIAAATLVPVAALIRPIAILFVAPFIATLIFAWLFKQISWKRALGASVIFVVIFIVGIAPWLARNHEVFGNASLSSLMPFQLYFYDGPAIYATAHHLSYADARKVLDARIATVTGLPYSTHVREYTEFSALTPILVHEGIKVALENPIALIETRFIQFFKFFVRDGIRYWIERYGIDTAHGAGFAAVVAERVILFVIMIGFFYTSVRALLSKNIPVLAMTFVVLYFAVLTGIMASAGLRYPAEPLFLLLGTFGLYELYIIIRNRLSLKT